MDPPVPVYMMGEPQPDHHHLQDESAVTRRAGTIVVGFTGRSRWDVMMSVTEDEETINIQGGSSFISEV